MFVDFLNRLNNVMNDSVYYFYGVVKMTYANKIEWEGLRSLLREVLQVTKFWLFLLKFLTI